MNKAQKFIIGLSVIGTVGITYVLTTLKDLPEAFDWSLEEDEEDE